MKPNDSKKASTQEEQLDFGLKEPLSNKYYNVKNKLYFSQALWQSQRFAKDSYIWLFIIISISTIAFQVYLLSIYFNQLPQSLPLLQMYVTPSLKLITKELVIIAPVITTIGFFISLPLGTKIYYENRYLSIFVLASSSVAGIFLSYSIIKLISNYI